MRAKQLPRKHDLGLVTKRLEHCSHRIYMASVDALQFYEIWSKFNDAKEQRRVVSKSPASIAAALYEEAVLRSLILIVVRLLDKPGPGGPLKSDKISFPVVRGLLAVPGVTDMFIERARNSISALLSEEPERRAEEVRGRIDFLGARMQHLEDEKPNRERSLRRFRDSNLAHELHPDERKPKPQYSHITSMVPEILALTEDVDLIVNGSPSIAWHRGEASASAAQLWSAVAAAFPLVE